MDTYLELEQVELLEAAAANLRDKLLIRLLFHLGCRISEALGLEVKDIDLKQATVSIQHLKARLKLNCPKCGANLGRAHVFCPKCGGKVDKPATREQERRKMRTLPLDRETVDMLGRYIARGGPVNRNGKKLIFGINRHRGWQIVTCCAEKAGLPNLVNPETGKARKVSPHRLRDCFAIHAMKLDSTGDSLRLLQQHLGHSNFNTTAKYRKISGEEHRGWYDKLWKGRKPNGDMNPPERLEGD